MRDTTIDLLTANEILTLKSDMSDLINDSQLRVAIVLGKKTEGTYVPGTGVMPTTWTRDALYAIRGNSFREHNLEKDFEVGDNIFLVKYDDYIDDLEVEIDIGDQLLELRYDVGTVNVTLSSATITGSGTSWLVNAGKGNYFRLKNETDFYEISAIASTTSMTVSPVYANSTKLGYPYDIYLRWQIINVVKDPLNILRKIHCRRVM